jgi:hypothetical protein
MEQDVKAPRKGKKIRVPRMDQMPLPSFTRYTIMDPETFAIEIKYVPIPGSAPAPNQKGSKAAK